MTTRPAVFTLTDRDGVLDGAAARVAWDYADDRANDAQPRERAVDRLVAGIFAARARQRAVELNRRGDYQAASEDLKATAKKIRGYAGSDPELRAIVDGLLAEAETVRARHARAQPQGGLRHERQPHALTRRAGEGAPGSVTVRRCDRGRIYQSTIWW